MPEQTVSGLEINPEWDKRYALSMKTPRHLVRINMTSSLLSWLSLEEIKRQKIKLELLESFASQLADGMLKGTFKYPTDTHSESEYSRELQDELGDFINYWVLKRVSGS